MNEREIFDAALAIPDSQQRAAFLEQACGENQTQRREIEEMLDAQQRLGSFLQGPPAGLEATIDSPVTEKPGMQVGPYKLLQQIGEGGFGVVYMAEQHKPVRRKVALKIIKPGMDTKEVIARFEAERQALALMDHPNIARVFDAGATETGRPFFVMELVRGIPMIEFCDENNLNTQQRLGLFVAVCRAVQHAHQKGILHRDLKPSNVMVTLHDNMPVPKVIDFGVSKAISQQLTEKTLFTAYGQMIGTPVYMSPEQAQMSGLDVDTRSDIYSLGVMLFELLTGSTPLDAERLRKSGYEEMQRLIREEDAPRPSQRLSTQKGAALAMIAKNRGTDPNQLGKQLRGELDWIVIKALEKDRNRRYETAYGFAADVERYLNNDAVKACPPSLAYRTRKFIHRNRGPVLSGGVVAVAVLLAVVGLGIGYFRAEAAAETAVREKQRAERAMEQERRAKSDFEELLHQSLVREGRALRLAGAPGFRTAVWDRLTRALALNVPNRELEAMRDEAVACMGSFVAQEPTMWDLPKHVTSMAFHPDGRTLAIGMSDGTVSIRGVADGKETARLQDTGAPSLPPQKLNRWDRDGDGQLTKAEVGERLGNYLARYDAIRDNLLDRVGLRAGRVQRPVRSVDFVDADTILVTASTAQFWRRDGASWQPGPSFGRAPSGAVVKDQRLVLGQSRRVTVWDMDSGERVSQFDVSARTDCIDVSPDLSTAALGMVRGGESLEHFLVLFDIETGVSRRLLKTETGGNVEQVAYSQDGALLGAAYRGGVVVYRVADAERIFDIRAESGFGVAIHPNNQLLAVASGQENWIRVWHLGTNQLVATLPLPKTPRRVAWSPEGSMLAASAGATVRIWNVTDTGETLLLRGHSGGVPGVSFSGSGRWLASVSKDQSVRIWDAATGRLHRILSASLPGPGQAVAFSHDERYVATGDYTNGSILIWDVESGTRVLELEHDCGLRIWSLAFSPDGQFFAAAGGGGVGVWRVRRDQTGSPPISLERSADPGAKSALYVRFSPDSRYLAWTGERAAGDAGRVRLWDLMRDTELLATPRRSAFNPIQNLSFFPHSERFICLDPQRVAVIRNLDGQVLSSFPAPGETGGSFSAHALLSPDGRWFAASSWTGRGVDLWNPQSGRRIASLPESQGIVWHLDWSHDSDRLAISRSNGEIDIWRISRVRSELAKLGLNW